MKRIGALVAAVALLLTACGGETGPDPQANPKEALVSAFENLANSEGMEMVLSLDATAESLNGLAGEGGQPMDDETAEKILDSSLRMLTRGKGEEAQFEMVATIAGEEDLEIKFIDKIMYFRADAEGLTETFGGDPAQLDAMAQQAAAQGMSFVKPALDGEWIAVTGTEELAQQFGGGMGMDANSMAQNQQKMIEEISAALEESATVTSQGSDDIGERLSVAIPIQKLYEKLMTTFQGIPGFPGGQMPPATEVPDENVTLQVWVDDDRVTQASLDFVQFMNMDGNATTTEGPVALLMEFEEFDDEIEAPDDAVEVPAEQIMQLFMGAAGMGGASMGEGGTMEVPPPGGGGGPPPNFDCDQLKGAPPAIKEQFADMCPDL